MRQLLALVPLLLAAACAGQASPPAAPAPAAPAVASLAAIAGEWDIVSFDGRSPAKPGSKGRRHSFVDLGAEGLRFAIGCNYFTIPGRIRAGVLHRTPGLDRRTQMGCGAEREARDQTLLRFFNSRPKVRLLPDGRLRMTAPGHDLLLERATARTVLDARAGAFVADPNLQGRWTILAVKGREGKGLWLELGGEGLGTVSRTERGVFEGSPQPPTRAHLGCNDLGLSGWTRNGDKLDLGWELARRTERGCDSATMAFEDAAFSVLRRTMTMELAQPGRLRLVNENGTLDLVRHGS